MTGKFILSDISYKSFASPGKEDDYNNERIPKFFDPNKGGKYWSHALCRSGTNQNTWLNPTGVPGYIMNIYYSLMFELPKDNWQVFKKDETIDVTPVHHQYYQITHGQKDTLEAKIRESMVKISQSIADIELVRHDLLKYEDFEKKLADSKLNPDEKGISPEEKKQREEKKNAAEMDLKATFVDEVDFHAGGGAQGAGRLSMAFMRNNNIMPTIVDDFFRMKSVEDLKKEPSLKNIPTVEQRMLEVKFGAYRDWLGYFENNVKRRMEALRTLEKSREKTLDEYREWLKPSIARYKMIADSLEREGDRKAALTLRIRTSGVATSYNNITLWFWKSFVPPDPHRVPQEVLEKSGVQAIGKWEYEHFYFHPDHGLVLDYPWITKEWIADNALDKDGNIKALGITEREWYYSFFVLTLGRTNIKTSATGAELEDGDFIFANYMMSKNVVAAKFLELKAYQEQEMEIYIDDMLGFTHKVKGMPAIIYAKKDGKYFVDSGQYNQTKRFKFYVVDDAGDKIDIKLPDIPSEGFKSFKDLKNHFPKAKKKKEPLVMLVERKKENKTLESVKETLGLGNIRFFLPGGPYERNWSERVKKVYLKPNSVRFEYVANFIKSKMNIGGG